MDAHALLTSQGWRGTGHSLHATTDTIGLAKPLLLNRRDGNKGLGTKAHFTSDQWWMNAFDEQLQGLQQAKTTDGSVGVVQTVASGRIGGIEKGMGGRWQLGGNFVRGGLLQGTLDMLEQQASSDESSTTEGDKSTGVSTGVSTPVEKETREERARRKMEKIARRAEREARRKRKAEEKKAKEARKKGVASGVVVKEVSSREGSSEKKRDETKEERKARKEAKRLRREARAAKKA